MNKYVSVRVCVCYLWMCASVCGGGCSSVGVRLGNSLGKEQGIVVKEEKM